MACGEDLRLRNYFESTRLDPLRMKEQGIKHEVIERSLCPTKVYIAVHNSDIGEMKNMASIINKTLKISRISSCQSGDSFVCDNGYVFKDRDVRNNNQHPAAFFDYINNRTTFYNDSNEDFAFVAFEMAGETKSFLISTEYADSLFVRMLTRSYITGFTLEFANNELAIYSHDTSKNNTTRSSSDAVKT